LHVYIKKQLIFGHLVIGNEEKRIKNYSLTKKKKKKIYKEKKEKKKKG
jgi:hypothetical protein